MITELDNVEYEVVKPENHRIPFHLHHYHQIDVMFSGFIVVSVEGNPPLRLEKGEGLLIPPLIRHAYRTNKAFSKGTYKFHVAPRYWTLLGRKVRPFRFSAGLFQCLKAHSQQPDAHRVFGQQQAIALVTLGVVESIGTHRAAVSADDNLDFFRQHLWPLLERIANEPHAGWSVSTMANECHLSSGHFSRCFHRIIGQRPQQYLIEARMRAAAAELLDNPSRSIKEIAERTKYTTIHSFSHSFKQAFGVSPAQYRRFPTRM